MATVIPVVCTAIRTRQVNGKITNDIAANVFWAISLFYPEAIFKAQDWMEEMHPTKDGWVHNTESIEIPEEVINAIKELDGKSE